MLAAAPNHADALHHLGLIAFQCGHTAPAIELMSRSVALEKQPFFLKNLAAAYRAAGRINEAAQALREALILAPHEPAIHEELGIVLDKLDRIEESVAEHREALAGVARIDGPKSAQLGFEAKAQMNLAPCSSGWGNLRRRCLTWIAQLSWRRITRWRTPTGPTCFSGGWRFTRGMGGI